LKGHQRREIEAATAMKQRKKEIAVENERMVKGFVHY